MADDANPDHKPTDLVFPGYQGRPWRHGAGGKSISARISAGGFEEVGGSASAATILNSRYELVLSGGSATATVIDSGGFVYVAASGTINGATISGGILDLIEIDAISAVLR